MRGGKTFNGGSPGIVVNASLNGIQREMQRLDYEAQCSGRGTDAASRERKMEQRRLIEQAERELIALEGRAEKTTEKPDIKTVRSLLLEKMDFRKHKLDRDILDKFVVRVVPETERVFQWYLNFNMADNRIETKQLVSEMHLTYKEAYDYRHEVKGALLRVSQWKDLTVKINI